MIQNNINTLLGLSGFFSRDVKESLINSVSNMATQNKNIKQESIEAGKALIRTSDKEIKEKGLDSEQLIEKNTNMKRDQQKDYLNEKERLLKEKISPLGDSIVDSFKKMNAYKKTNKEYVNSLSHPYLGIDPDEIAMQSMQQKGQAMVNQRRNFKDYMKDIPTNYQDLSVGDLSKGAQQYVAKQYTRNEKQRIMNQMDKEKK